MNPISRSIVALGTLACSCAFAQSTVTLSGALDVYVADQSATGKGHRRVVNSGFNPNSLAFTGTEDLGGGLKAGFVLDSQPVLDTGTVGQGGKFWGRQSFIFISGDWGRLNFGRQHTAGRAFGVKYAASGWLTVDPIGQLEFAMGAGISPAMNADTAGSRVNNSVSYSSPKLGGLSFSVLQSASEGGTFASGQAKITILGLNYAAGPFTADFVYNRIPAIAGSQVKQDDYGIGATYDAKITKILIAVQVKRGSAVATAGSTSPMPGSEATDKFFTVGAQIPTSQGVVGVSAGKLFVADAHKGKLPANISPGFGGPMDNATAWAVSYTHSLSKRSSLFAAYGTLDNSGSGIASLVPDLRPVGGGTSRVFGTGMRHSF